MPPSRLTRYADFEAMLEALHGQRITATVMSFSNFVLSARADASLQAGVFVGSPGSAAWGVRKKDPDLLRSLNDYVENLRKTATWSRLVVKYFGDEALKVLGPTEKQ